MVVPQVNANTNFPVKNFSAKPVAVEPEPVIIPQEKKAPEPVAVFETEEGDVPEISLAFIPGDIRNLQTSAYDCLLINDSNYFLFYNLIVGDDRLRRSVSNGIIEPNIQEEVVTLRHEDLNDWENIRVQIVLFKRDKTYEPQQAIDTNLRIAPVKFYKLHSFTENDYFNEPAMVISLTGKPLPALPVDPEQLKRAMYEKEPVAQKKESRNKISPQNGVIEVDLHIDELVDTTAGMSNADMLRMQLDKFHAVISENIRKKGQKIVFIHGKGEGVLRNEILKQLKTKYKSFYYQDASFREYGFGATMVVIR